LLWAGQWVSLPSRLGRLRVPLSPGQVGCRDSSGGETCSETTVEAGGKKEKTFEPMQKTPATCCCFALPRMGSTRFGMSPRWVSPGWERRCSRGLGAMHPPRCILRCPAQPRGTGQPHPSGRDVLLSHWQAKTELPQKRGMFLQPLRGQPGPVAIWGHPGMPCPPCCQAGEHDKL